MIVLDASAAVDMVRGTEEGLCFRQLALKGEPMIAPHLYVSEVANALLKYVRAGCCDAGAAVVKSQEAYDLVEEYVSDEELMPEALLEAATSGHSAYDTLYLVLARRRKATLFTRDKNLQDLCEQRGIECIYQMSL